MAHLFPQVREVLHVVAADAALVGAVHQLPPAAAHHGCLRACASRAQRVAVAAFTGTEQGVHMHMHAIRMRCFVRACWFEVVLWGPGVNAFHQLPIRSHRMLIPTAADPRALAPRWGPHDTPRSYAPAQYGIIDPAAARLMLPCLWPRTMRSEATSAQSRPSTPKYSPYLQRAVVGWG